MAMQPLPPELGTAEQLLTRFGFARSRRNQWTGYLSDIFKFTAPNRETYTERKPGSSRYKDVYDSTGISGSQRYVSRLIAKIMPSWTRWSILTPGADWEDRPEARSIAEILEKISDDMFRYLNLSNFYQVLPEACRDMTGSTGALKIDRGDVVDPFRCQAQPLASVYFEEGPHGTLENVWREPNMTVPVIEREYQGVEIPAEWGTADAAKKGKDFRPKVLEGTLVVPGEFRADDEYWSFLIAVDENKLIWTQFNGKGPGASPWVIFREDKIPGEVMGRGRAMAALPDIMTLNQMVKFDLQNLALGTAGAWTAVSDGVLNPYTTTIYPGTTIPVASNSNTNPTLKALERAGDPVLMDAKLAALRESVKDIFLNNTRPVDAAIRSATEASIEDRDQTMEEASVYGRLQTELATQTIQRLTFIMIDLGLAPVLRVDGREVTVKHTSPLSRAQDHDDIMAISQLYEVGNATVGPEIMTLGIRGELVPEALATRLGVPTELIREEAERDEMIAAGQQQAAEIQGQEPAGATQ